MHGRKQLAAWIERAKFSTDRAAADFLGLDVTYLCHILAGSRQPGLANAVKLEQKTGIPVVSWTETDVDKLEPVGRRKREKAGR